MHIEKRIEEMKGIDKKHHTELSTRTNKVVLKDELIEWVRQTLAYSTPGMNVLATSLVRISK